MKFHVLIALLLATTTLSCGGQNDNRIVLHSEFANALQIPAGMFEGRTLFIAELERLIPRQLIDISEVSNISIRSFNPLRDRFPRASTGFLPLQLHTKLT